MVACGSIITWLLRGVCKSRRFSPAPAAKAEIDVAHPAVGLVPLRGFGTTTASGIADAMS